MTVKSWSHNSVKWNVAVALQGNTLVIEANQGKRTNLLGLFLELDAICHWPFGVLFIFISCLAIQAFCRLLRVDS